MSDLKPVVRPSCSSLNRRHLLGGLVAGALAAGSAGTAAAPRPVTPRDHLHAYVKLRADVAGAAVLAGGYGSVWAWIPGENSAQLFSSYTLTATRAVEVAEGIRLHHHEITCFLAPGSGAPLGRFENPLTGEIVDAQPEITDRAGRLLAWASPGVTAELRGEELMFEEQQAVVEPALLDRARFPRQVQHELHQALAFESLIGRAAEVADPERTSAGYVSSRSRTTQWLPFLEMGNRPGVLVHRQTLRKLSRGAAEIPEPVAAYLNEYHPEMLVPPIEWLEARAAADRQSAARAARGI